MGAAMSPAAWLLAAIAARFGSTVPLFRIQRAVLLALFSEQVVLQVFDLGIFENNLLFKRFYLGFNSVMLCFPIVCLPGEIDVLLFGNRDVFLGERRR